MTQRLDVVLLCASLGLTPTAQAQAPAPPPARAEPAWIAKSDENARLLLQATAAFAPEAAGRAGLDGLDAEVLDLKPGLSARLQAALVAAQGEARGPTRRGDRSERPAGSRDPDAIGQGRHRRPRPQRQARGRLLRRPAHGLPGHSRAPRRPGSRGAPRRGPGAAPQVRGARARHDAHRDARPGPHARVARRSRA